MKYKLPFYPVKIKHKKTAPGGERLFFCGEGYIFRLRQQYRPVAGNIYGGYARVVRGVNGFNHFVGHNGVAARR